MALLATLQYDPTADARLRTALASAHDLLPTADWTVLWDVIHNRPVEGCIVDPYHPTEPTRLRELIRLRRREPPLAIVVYADFVGREMDLFELGHLNVDSVILAGTGDSSPLIRKSVTHALGSSVAQRVARSITGRLPPLGVDSLRWSIEYAHRAPGVTDLATGVHRHPRELAADLRDDHLPTPRRFLLWGRVFRAAYMLRNSDCTVEQAAYTLGYASGTGLARAVKRETGHPPTEVMRRGGIACVLDAFLRSCPRRPSPPRESSSGGPRSLRDRPG